MLLQFRISNIDNSDLKAEGIYRGTKKTYNAVDLFSALNIKIELLAADGGIFLDTLIFQFTFPALIAKRSWMSGALD